MADWHQLWLGELAAVKAAFEGAKASLPPGGPPLPPHAGRVVLIRGLLASVERVAGHLAGMGAAVPAVPKAAESAAAYEALHAGLGQCASALNMQARGWVGGWGAVRAAADLAALLLMPSRPRLLHTSSPPAVVCERAL